MHQTRKEASKKLPIPKKGTKYLARASSHLKDSVPVVIAIRDMLQFAKTAKEVKQMIQQKLLKINGKTVRDLRESIKLFNLFEADKLYRLTLSPTRKFTFEEVSQNTPRLTKVINKRLVSEGKIQLNLHDGTNILAKGDISVGDSLYLNEKNAIKKKVSLTNGSEIMVISGKYLGSKGKIQDLSNSQCTISYKEGSLTLKKNQVIAL